MNCWIMRPVGNCSINAANKLTTVTGRSQAQPVCIRHSRCRARSAAAESATAITASSASDSTASTLQQIRPSSSCCHKESAEWEACVVKLQDMGFSEQDADRFVERAFGWGAKARSYWRHEKREQPADHQQLDSVVRFLLQLGVTDEQLFKVVKAFPEVLGCDVEKQLQGNVDKLQKDWKLQGDVLVKAVLRQPAVLGYNLDCMGDCAGECNRCWARF